MLLPQLRTFQPDLLFISAGFDAHQDDFYHFLTELDIHWITEQLVDVVHQSGGQGVSVVVGQTAAPPVCS
jgi:acetoin utilization deacetylase AcuC-like enzyme